MKPLRLFPLFCLCLLLSCSKNSNDVVITGNLTSVEDGTVITLSRTEGQLIIPLLTDTLTNGAFRFEFTDSTDIAKSYNLFASGEGFPPTSLDIWVKPGEKTKISGNNKSLRTWDVKSNVPEQKELNRYIAKTKDYQNRWQSIFWEVQNWIFTC